MAIDKRNSLSVRFLTLLSMVLIAGFATGCATVVPVHEAEPPEVLTGGDFRVSMFAANSPMIASETSPVSNAAVLFPAEGWRFGFGLMDNFQVNLEALGAGTSGGVSGSLKYQWKGDPYFSAKKGNKSQTTIVRSFSSAGIDLDTDQDGNIYPYADLTATGLDIAHLFGYRTADWFGVYAGPKLISGDVTAEYKNVEDGPVVAKEKRSFSGFGLIAGLHFSFTGPHVGFDITLEYDGFQLPATYGDDKAWYSGYAIAFGLPFGF